MNKKDRGFLYGISLGDGCITKQDSNANYGLFIGHGPSQKGYLEHKAERLLSVFGGKAVNIRRYVGFNKQTNKHYENYQLRKTHPYFNQMHKCLYPNGKKEFTRKALNYLTEEGLAYWLMDDGSGSVLKNKRGQFCGCNFRLSTYCSKAEADLIAEWFSEKFDLPVSFDRDTRNDLYSLRFTTTASKKLAGIVEPYIIPTMRYKIEGILSYSPRVLDTQTDNAVGEDIV